MTSASRRLRPLFFLAILCLTAGCSPAPSLRERLLVARQLTEAQHWRRLDLATSTFTLRAYLPEGIGTRWKSQPGGLLTVYIEGDGLSWLTASRPSSDPTPIDPVALRLAVCQPDGQAAYLARPCQYNLSRDGACASRFWTSHRFAPQVVAATNQALEQLLKATGAKRLRLVGYSGGGAVALLAAADRHDVDEVLTVAGNLDPPAWTSLHHVSPLAGSLNPADHAAELRRLPQVHFVGGEDQIMPPEVAESYLARQGQNNCSRLMIVPGATHGQGWVTRWPSLLRTSPPCVRPVGR